MNEVDLEKAHLVGQERYAYFLLAAAGAARLSCFINFGGAISRPLS